MILYLPSFSGTASVIALSLLFWYHRKPTAATDDHALAGSKSARLISTGTHPWGRMNFEVCCAPPRLSERAYRPGRGRVSLAGVAPDREDRLEYFLPLAPAAHRPPPQREESRRHAGREVRRTSKVRRTLSVTVKGLLGAAKTNVVVGICRVVVVAIGGADV